MKFAAIDIGTNAVRLLLTNVIENGSQPIFKKEALVRMPLRLGDDAFHDQKISGEKTARLVDTMIGFRHLIEAYPAVDFLAYATSAMREASNGAAVAESVRKRSGINLEIIDGSREAEVIYANHIEERLDPERTYLYVDVGGGSTEITIINRGAATATRSFRVGTVRMLRDVVDEGVWDDLKSWIKTSTAEFPQVIGIGSGGNINKMFKLARVKEGRPITYKRIRELHRFLRNHTLQERIGALGMRPDRADVIVPAGEIYLSVMKWAKIKRIYVPQFGLSDGIVHLLWEKHKQAS